MSPCMDWGTTSTQRGTRPLFRCLAAARTVSGGCQSRLGVRLTCPKQVSKRLRRAEVKLGSRAACSAKCSDKCEVRHTGARWRVLSHGYNPQASCQRPNFGVPLVHTGAWTPQTGVPVHAGSRLLSAPCCRPCTRRHARPMFEFRSCCNLTCRARARRPGFWLEATAPALPCCSGCRLWRCFDFDRS